MKAWEALTGACETHGVSVERERERERESKAQLSIRCAITSKAVKIQGRWKLNCFPYLTPQLAVVVPAMYRGIRCSFASSAPPLRL